MKIIITEQQLSNIVNKKEWGRNDDGPKKFKKFKKKIYCLCDDGTYSIECCETYKQVPSTEKHVSDSLNVIKYALSQGIDLKHSASNSKYRTSWFDLIGGTKNQRNDILKIIPSEYRNYIPEIVSGVDKNFKFDVRLIDILSEIEKISGLELIITGGRDYFHKPKNPNSKHNTGKAVDFVPVDGMNAKNDKKIEEAVLKIILSGRYGMEIGLINERVYPSGHASGPHFHLSLDINVEYSNFGFIDMNGISSDTKVSSNLNLKWGNGGPYPPKILDRIHSVQVQKTKNIEKEKEKISLEKIDTEKENNMKLEKVRLDNLFSTLKSDNSYTSYCENLIKIKNENPNDVSKIPTELLIKKGDINETLTFCEMLLEPLVKLDILPAQNVLKPSVIGVEKIEKDIEEYYNLLNLSTVQLIRKKIEYKNDPTKSNLIFKINQILKERIKLK